jgi:hypothetical protein
MASEKDLIDKADALLRRHALNPGNETGTYPVLTDLVVPPELQEAPAAAEEPSVEEPAEEPSAPPQEDEETRLRDEIVAGVLRDVRTRLGVELERQVAEALAPQLRAAVAEALAGLQDRLAAVVAEAVERSLGDRPVK